MVEKILNGLNIFIPFIFYFILKTERRLTRLETLINEKKK